MSIIDQELDEHYPLPDDHDKDRPAGITRLEQCISLRDAYRAGACRTPIDREIEAAARRLFEKESAAQGLVIDLDGAWERLLPGDRATYRQRARSMFQAAREEALR